MISYYFSSSYPRKLELRWYAEKLRNKNCGFYRVVSSWLDDPEVADDGISMPAGHNYQAFAERDMQDIDQCDTLVAFTEPPGGPGRGGRHIECGYALAKKKAVVVIGHRENTFHHLKNVTYCKDWAAFYGPCEPNPYVKPAARFSDILDPISPSVEMIAAAAGIRKFDTGATRDTDTGKLCYSGFLSPIVLQRYAQYMHKHRVQKDGTLREPDNWQRGIPLNVYEDSLLRHEMDLWLHHRGFKDAAVDADVESVLCAIMFNTMGYLHEHLKAKRKEIN